MSSSSSWIQSAFGSKISPIILFIIVLLAIIFFIAALLHLVIRFLLKQTSPNPQAETSSAASRAFQRQLQHLFHLHDSGLDQSLIDTLPVFLYKDIMGLKEPFDCAVCLCEFTEQDKLRLLPVCSHAFHIDCIDTWLLSNSSCPLCRGAILSFDHNPCVYFDHLDVNKEVGNDGSSRNYEDHHHHHHQYGGEVSSVLTDKRVFSVRLGKFKNSSSSANNVPVDDGGLSLESGEIGETSGGQNGNLTCDGDGGGGGGDVGRRCFSMGSFQYVVADSELQVALCDSGKDRKGKGGQSGHLTCDQEGKKIKVGESFSVSKIWQWSKKSKLQNSTSVAQFV